MVSFGILSQTVTGNVFHLYYGWTVVYKTVQYLFNTFIFHCLVICC